MGNIFENIGLVLKKELTFDSTKSELIKQLKENIDPNTYYPFQELKTNRKRYKGYVDSDKFRLVITNRMFSPKNYAYLK